MSYVYMLPFKILFQQVFISLSSLFRKHGSFFFWSFGFFSSLLVQFTSVCVPWETVSKWILNSSLIFILRNWFNLRAARFRKAASYWKRNQKGWVRIFSLSVNIKPEPCPLVKPRLHPSFLFWLITWLTSNRNETAWLWGIRTWSAYTLV